MNSLIKPKHKPKKKYDEAYFLSGRHSRFREAIRVLKIAMEFIRGFRALHWTGPAVTVFGSARFSEGHPYYELGRQVGQSLAKQGFTVITGGGPGVMEAANRGAKEAGGKSIGCNIVLPHEQEPNRFLDQVITFYYFFVRKVMLIKYSHAFIILPGGLGTLDELSEAATLIQTGKLYDFPVILMGNDYWQGFRTWIDSVLVKQGAVSEDDLEFLRFTDDPQEMISIILQSMDGLNLKLIPISSNTD